MPAIEWRPRVQPHHNEENTAEVANQNPPNFTQRLNAIDFPHEDIPVEFIDYIFEYEIMDDPVLLDNQHVMDYGNLKKWWAKSERDKINPITNIPYVSIKILTDLKEQIETFVSQQEFRSAKFLKEFEEKLQSTRQKREQAEKERNKMIEIHSTLRKELSQKIESSMGELDEKKLDQLFAQLERIDKKIRKLHLGNAYHNDPGHLRSRIQAILVKHEREGITEKSEKKLKHLLEQLDRSQHTTKRYISRIPLTFFSSPPAGQEGGLQIIANSSNEGANLHQNRFDL